MTNYGAAVIIALLKLGSPDVELSECAADHYDPASLRKAIQRATSTTAIGRVRVSLPDCTEPGVARIDGPFFADSQTRTATVSLVDVAPQFRIRTLAYVAVDLARRPTVTEAPRVELESQPPRPPSVPVPLPLRREPSTVTSKRWSSGVIVGAVVRAGAGGKATAGGLPFFAIDASWRAWGRFEIGFAISYEGAVADRFVIHGLRGGAGPSLLFLSGRLRLRLSAQYYGGVVFLQGRGAFALDRIATVAARGAEGTIALQWTFASTWSVALQLGSGYEWGVDGLRFGEALVSTHGAFGRGGIGIQMDWLP